MANEHDHGTKRTSPSGPRPLPKSDLVVAAQRYGAGDVIADKYRLTRRLGEGGMGEVWLAHNETLDIDVAIKLIRAESGSLPEQADRLLNEARAAARLGHPAIVRVNDFGKTDRGDPFIVMERLEGEDLADALARRGRLSATKAVRTILPIAHALTLAHTKGIIHRDLKPENIYLSQADESQVQPKLVDFGVAKLEAQHNTRLTQTGALLGSPLYMSPEQARGDDVDHRADIWALGVVLYEMITGRPPFEGKNYNAVLYSITANPPTPITDLGVGDEELWSVVERALQKDPDRRWYSMRDFGEALATWLSDRGFTEDITGGSLSTTWLNWQREDGDQGSQRPHGGRNEDGTQPVEIPPPPALPSRSREQTVKRQRGSDQKPLVYGAAAGGVLLLVVATLLLSSREKIAEPRAAESSAAAPSPAEKPVFAGSPAAEVTHAAPTEPALDPSALPTAMDEPEPPKVEKKSKPAQKKAPAMSRGITIKDPYAAPGPPKSALKDPFK